MFDDVLPCYRPQIPKTMVSGKVGSDLTSEFTTQYDKFLEGQLDVVSPKEGQREDAVLRAQSTALGRMLEEGLSRPQVAKRIGASTDFFGPEYPVQVCVQMPRLARSEADSMNIGPNERRFINVIIRGHGHLSTCQPILNQIWSQPDHQMSRSRSDATMLSSSPGLQ